MDIRDFHDATLCSICIDWHSESATIEFLAVGKDTPKVTISAGGIKEVNMTNHRPWGHSVSVNSVLYIDDTNIGFKTIEIEMQTGDTINIKCDSCIIYELGSD